MGLVSTQLVPDASSVNYQKKNRSYSIVWQVIFSHQATELEAIQAVGFYPGMSYPYDSLAFCSGLSCSYGDALSSPYVQYRVTVNFTTDEDEQKPYENPLDEPPKVSYGYDSMEVEVLEDKDGEPIVNKAGDAILGATYKEALQTITVTRNEASFNRSQAAEYFETINTATWNGYPAETVLCRGIGASTEQTALGENGSIKIKYFVVTYEFVARVRVVDGDTLKWRFKCANEGRRALFGGARGKDWIKNSDINEDTEAPDDVIDEPVLLTDTGTIRPDGEDPVPLEFSLWETKNFGSLNITLP